MSLGRAAHITAAASGGPRYDSSLSPKQRAAQANGIWVCANCSDRIDKDPVAFPVTLLQRLKQEGEDEAKRRLGRAKAPSDPFHERERQVKRDLKTRRDLERAMLKPFDPRNPNRKPPEAFVTSKIIVRSLDDTTYGKPGPDPPGTSSWYRTEPYSFYHGGLMVIVWLNQGIIDDAGRWALIKYNEDLKGLNLDGFRSVQVWVLGKIPWRNIRAYDFKGDEYYNEPHLYCAFADDGTPYEGYAYYLDGDTYDWPLDPNKEIRLERRTETPP